MLKFKYRRNVPPGGVYFFQVPGTSVILRAPTMRGMEERVAHHLASNNLPPIADISAAVEDYMCLSMPSDFCEGDPAGRARAVVASLAEIRAETLRIAAARKFVAPGVARRRVEVCSVCPENDRRLCTSCVGLVAWARRLVPLEAPGDAWLGICAVDLTALVVKVHIDRKFDPAVYPAACWVEVNKQTDG